MNILISGGTGFIGKALCHRLTTQGHQLWVLSRQPEKVTQLCGSSVIGINIDAPIPDNINFQAVVNLAGEGIADKRWSSSRKQQLIDSRIQTTQKLVDWVKQASYKPTVFISGSAIGWYGDQGSQQLDEQSKPRNEFTHRLCQQWEDTAKPLEDLGVRLCLLRTGLVIGKDGGFLKRMLLPFKMGAGGRMGDGAQWMSWIHMEDMLGLILFLIDHPTISGPINATAPTSVMNSQFTRVLAKKLNRPAIAHLPSWFLKGAFGEMATLLISGQRVLPQKAQSAGYHFVYEELDKALQDIL
ncbi:TIGR01777 family oxidoreductase [Pelagibaculum spongiae]|uniref:TIGR01777 family protein n=1 Tax=Pelagibaculum spongiae TaxID=2080658 RepID=A0A2V1GWR5_9GAMM|nr:TIGR01777 family oxidoreductase [Pelagibaculum spongiae]PVZ64990.1 TIGR01777 family protein [Pelagibaculum spongiae]